LSEESHSLNTFDRNWRWSISPAASGAKAGHGRRSGESPAVSVAVALSWPVSDAEGRETQAIGIALNYTDLRIRHSHA
jgi:hypothetical protein